MIPAFSAAIFSIVSPRNCIWSIPIDAMITAIGFLTTFVASSLPPIPVSNNTTSTSSSDEVKTADNSHIARYGILVVFALLDAVMAFFALRLRRRDD